MKSIEDKNLVKHLDNVTCSRREFDKHNDSFESFERLYYKGLLLKIHSDQDFEYDGNGEFIVNESKRLAADFVKALPTEIIRRIYYYCSPCTATCLGLIFVRAYKFLKSIFPAPLDLREKPCGCSTRASSMNYLLDQGYVYSKDGVYYRVPPTHWAKAIGLKFSQHRWLTDSCPYQE